MSDFTNEELAALQQLNYLNNDVSGEAKLGGNIGGQIDQSDVGRTVRQHLAAYDEKALLALEQSPKTLGAHQTGKEWADTIRTLQNNPSIGNLHINSVMEDSRDPNNVLAIAFKNNDQPINSSDSVIVSFNGTSGGYEWNDNITGLNKTDTISQQEALAFVDSLGSQNITAIGHSKGGNKSMYVGIVSDNVTRVVAFDGQGFNGAFFDKYQAEICERGVNITNISVNTDYVNALLAQFPNSHQYYVRGDGNDSLNDVASHHVPASMFNRNPDGSYLLDANGNITFVYSPKDPRMEFETGLTIYLMNSATDADLEIISQYAQGIVTVAFGDKKSEEMSVDTFLADTEGAGITLAYVFRYLENTGQSTRNVGEFLEAISVIEDYDDWVIHIDTWIYKGEIDLIQFLYDRVINSTVNDPGMDRITRWILGIIGDRYGVDAVGIYDQLHEKYWEIEGSGRENSSAPGIACNETRDFSDETICTIEEAHSSIAQVELTSVNSWSSYAGEEWYSQIFAASGVSGNNAYDAKLMALLERTVKEIRDIFTEANQLDKQYAGKMDTATDGLSTLAKKIASIAESIG